MKTTLIIFAVLLFLLTLLSSFGGSLRSEPYINRYEKYEETQMSAQEKKTLPMGSAMQQMPSAMQQMPSAYPQAPELSDMTSQSQDSTGPMFSEPSYPQYDSQETSYQLSEDQGLDMSVPIFKGPVPEQNTTGQEMYKNYPKIDFPEPFMNPNQEIGAPI